MCTAGNDGQIGWRDGREVGVFSPALNLKEMYRFIFF